MNLSRRHILQALLAMPGLGLSATTLGAGEVEIQRGPSQPFKADHVVGLARKLAARQFTGHRSVAPEWEALHYDQYKQIHFRNEAALWHGSQLPFEAQLLLPGMLHRNPLEIFVVESDQAWPLLFSMDLFRSEHMPPLDPAGAGGFSGVRLLSAPHRGDGMAEFAVFQGGSYFRAVARDQDYGLSARGLAIRTADARGEEFPVFRSIWLETPEPFASGIRLHALMDSESLSGAYTFMVKPGATTVIEVEAVLFPRVSLDQVGIAPMSSMFKFNQTNRWKFDDFRSGVHDSDGLLIANGAGERLWRPLANPAQLQVSSFLDENPRGFGLMQRERDFRSFGDLVTRYHDRPSLWVKPRGGWGRGAVFLVEIPTDTEVNDNVVTFWRPAKPWPAGSSQRVNYHLSWGWVAPISRRFAPVLSSRLGRNLFGGLMAAVDFAPHPEFQDLQLIEPDVSVGGGHLHRAWIERNDHTGGLRLSFGFGPEGAEALELRAQLRKDGVPQTEVWLYRWTS